MDSHALQCQNFAFPVCGHANHTCMKHIKVALYVCGTLRLMSLPHCTFMHVFHTVHPFTSVFNMLQVLTLEESVPPFEAAYDVNGVDWSFISRNPHVLPESLKWIEGHGAGNEYENLHWCAPLPVIVKVHNHATFAAQFARIPLSCVGGTK
jgi:hypothetical protein